MNREKEIAKTSGTVKKDGNLKTKKRVFIEKVPSIFTIIFSTFIFITLLTMLIIDKRMNKVYIPNEVEFSNMVLYPFVLGTLFLLIFINIKELKKITLSNKRFYMGLGIYFVIVFILQLIISYSIYFYTDWDVMTILRNAENIGINGATELEQEYFSLYPNNIILTYSLALLYKIGGIVHPNNPYAVVLGCISLIICISVYLATLCIHRITQSKRITTIFAILGTILIALSPWIVIPYSDQVAMIFPILSLTAYLFIKNEYAKNIIITFLCTIGYFYKPTVIIFLMAYIIVRLFAVIKKLINNKKINYKKYIFIIFLMVLSMGTAFGISKIITSFNKTELNKEAKMTMTHFFMMGLSEKTEGRYDGDDVILSMSCYDTESRQRTNINEAIRRMQNMGVSGLIKHIIRKNMLNYNNGTFGWGAEGIFYSELRETESKFAQTLRSFYYNRNQMGEYYQVFATIEQFVWLLVLTCICLNLLKNKEKTNNEETVSIISTTLMGVSLFLLLFECRARYLYVFSPLFIVLAGIGVNNIKQYICQKKHNIY